MGLARLGQGVFGRSETARPVTIAGLLFASLLLLAPPAEATTSATRHLAGGVERTTYMVGPIDVTSGQNRIAYKPITGSEKPSESGWITRIKPNLVRADGSIPLSSKVMFHHGVWLNLSRTDATADIPERFYATGEEKTNLELPDGYGYRYEKSDVWILNHMIHNLTPEPMTLYVTYTIDFIPDSAPEAASIEPGRPIWMDVENYDVYPVFDVWRGSGGSDDKFVYPDDAKNPYPDGVQKNEWTVDRDGVLIGTVGHVHTGGLATDLYLERERAKYRGPNCGKYRKKKSGWSKERKKKQKRKLRNCRKNRPNVKGGKAHLFKSTAHYYEPGGPISWDVAMVGTKPNWRVGVKEGDTLSMTTTYETKRASWPESMGIMIAYMADGEGRNPYRKKVDYKGVVNHGHYAENNDRGGKKPVVGPDPRDLPDGLTGGGPFGISGFTYGAGDFRLPGTLKRPPVIEQGEQFTFQLSEGDASRQIWHSLTSCKAPCNKSTGIAYPIPDGEFQFDSGQLGDVTPAVLTRTWKTPKNLPVGTHTYFCRIHPLMRGAIRVVKKK